MSPVLTYLPNMPLYIARIDGRCIVRGCLEMATHARLTTQSGFVVSYCEKHEEQALELFGPEGAD